MVSLKVGFNRFITAKLQLWFGRVGSVESSRWERPSNPSNPELSLRGEGLRPLRASRLR